MDILKKNLDMITQAYFFELGKEFGEQVRTRIHWICERVKGSRVLDVGCSQGITSILLAREGKRVIGLDISEEAIEYANNYLSNESVFTQQNVEFIHSNFTEQKFDEKFDTVIFGEVLEHLFDPKMFMDKALELLDEDGRIIVTVPFGINDYFDHKKTYYLYDLLQLMNDTDLVLAEIKFFGKWIGVVYTKENIEVPIKFDLELLMKLEESFYQVERQYLKTIEKYKNEIDSLRAAQKNNNDNLELEKFITQLAEMKEAINNLSSKKFIGNEFLEAKNERYDLMKEFQDTKQILEGILTSIHQESEKSNERFSLVENLYNSFLQYKDASLINEKESIIKLKKELQNAYEAEERALKQLKKINERYYALKNSKFGRIATLYWRFRKKVGGRT
ncbi:methyltransferase domain-containing protein [Insulibacter thermoxylanivorax]|uniref:methyltransferase domain-containing protein n=1 Tax=Insulibacter thermoxylanivorax TaxID=2749268 RepID=UPI001910A20E|nr:methyltransferase domain-containing protein [Insulibacter thermoxylanivorax]